MDLSPYSESNTALSSAVNLNTTNCAGTLYLLNSNTPTVTPITSSPNSINPINFSPPAPIPLVPVTVNGSTISGNVTFTLYNTNNINNVVIIFTNFNNISTNDVIRLNNRENSITCYVDSNKNLYYYFTDMTLSFTNYKTTNIGTVLMNASPSTSAPAIVSLVSSTTNTLVILPVGYSLTIQNNESNSPSYLYLVTDSLPTNGSGTFLILNNTPDTVNYTYGTFANFTSQNYTPTVPVSRISTVPTSTATTAPISSSYYNFVIKAGGNALIIYNKGAIIYPVLTS